MKLNPITLSRQYLSIFHINSYFYFYNDRELKEPRSYSSPYFVIYNILYENMSIINKLSKSLATLDKNGLTDWYFSYYYIYLYI